MRTHKETDRMDYLEDKISFKEYIDLFMSSKNK